MAAGDKGATHYLNTYFSYDNREVMTATAY